MSKELVGYKLVRYRNGTLAEDCSGWLYLGTDPIEVGYSLAIEIDQNKGLPAEECDEIRIKAVSITQEEIKNLSEYGG